MLLISDQMCSIAIPSEILLGHSPPVYGSLFYNSLMVTTPSINSRSAPPQIRPCLAPTSLHLDNLLKSNNGTALIKRTKKKVVFADDRGRPLTQVPY
jgi:protein phosphatase 1 regulatory subunit 3A/B/C/D/E